MATNERVVGVTLNVKEKSFTVKTTQATYKGSLHKRRGMYAAKPIQGLDESLRPDVNRRVNSQLENLADGED